MTPEELLAMALDQVRRLQAEVERLTAERDALQFALDLIDDKELLT